MLPSGELRPVGLDETRDGSIAGATDGATHHSSVHCEGGSAAASREKDAPGGSAVSLPERYEDRGLLGSGGFGEVRRVYERKLGRFVAMKLVKPELRDAPRLRARFLAEIALTARLNHPGIISIFDAGELEDGRLWFTMPEVRGRTLRAVIGEAFAARSEGAGSPADLLVRRRRLLDLFARVCDAVAYAHSRGVIHRDLKPDNVMIGEFGRVMVMDWGLARRFTHEGLDDEEGEEAAPRDGEPRAPDDRGAEPLLTRVGEVVGTPAYMAPEQARGDVLRHGPAADVYALGGILFHTLTGRKPTAEATGPTGDATRSAALTEAGAPPELASICRRAMADDPEERYADAGALVVEIEAFLSGARRRERALERLHEALSTGPALGELRARAAELRAEAAKLLADRRRFDPVALKLPGWEREDLAARLEQEAALGEVEWIGGVHGALAIDPELPEAHAALADHYKARLVKAERARRHDEAQQCELLLRAHDRGRHASFLSGMGALTLVTDPPGARVLLERYLLQERRLAPVIVGELGATPIVDLPLEKGSYRLRVTAPGRIEVRVPVLIERGERWDGRPPGSADPFPLPLPRLDEVDDDEVYVPAGWALMGGDPDAPDSLPFARLWIDGFIVGRYPVTNAQYLAFLNDLVKSGREAEALVACPRPNRALVEQGKGELSFVRGPDGLFDLDPEDMVERWTPRGPASLMSWHGAMAYARWLRARTGRPYRLIHELEREKAVRGVDGRIYPWGDRLDPTWGCMLDSHEKEPMRANVDDYPADESPYGLRGGAGNSHDHCLNLWTLEEPRAPGGRVLIEAAPLDGSEYRAVRGGGWSSVENHCRAAARFAMRPEQRHNSTGLRVARDYP